MPVYVYHCDNCGHQFEINQRFSDDPLKKCPECGKIQLHKVFTPVSIIYKGSGFYSTDHRSSSGASSARSAKDSSGEQNEAKKSETEKSTVNKSSSD